MAPENPATESSEGQEADLVLMGGKIVTVDPACPDTQAVAIRGDRFVAVGSNQQIQPFIGHSTLVMELDGKVAVPGFIESHGHLVLLGEALEILDLSMARNWSTIVEMVRQAVKGAAPGEWIRGWGWHQDKWDEEQVALGDRFPTHIGLSEAAPDNPILLTHASGHLCITNAYGMRLAGIADTVPDPPGGRIVRDREGKPTGVLIEVAAPLIEDAAHESEAERNCWQLQEDRRRTISRAARECLSKGVTGFHDAGADFETIDLLGKMAEANELDLRLYEMIDESNERLRREIQAYRILGRGGNKLTVRAIKRFMDGALGARSAWLLEPYSDLASSTGFSTLLKAYPDWRDSSESEQPTPKAYIQETARIAIEHGFQLCTHAIGDRAVRETLNVYEQIFAEYPNRKDLRWRIEHASVVAPPDIRRFGELDVIAAVQAISCLSDGLWMIDRLGETRARERAFAFRQLLDTGAVLINGSDAPVEDVDPLPGFYASVSCTLEDGTVFWPEQRMSREEALRSCTLDAARAAFQEQNLGSITPGKLADIVVLSEDIMTIPAEEILRTRVLLTIVGGKLVYQRQM
jgi:predicted amidohydrolase YtcJ